MRKIDSLSNLLLNMMSGLLPKDLSSDEVRMLKDKFGENWFEELGYNEVEYERPRS